MSVMVSQITGLMIVYSTFYSRCRSKKTSNLCITGLCLGNSPVTGECRPQRASNSENVSIWWCHHDYHPSTSDITMKGVHVRKKKGTKPQSTAVQCQHNMVNFLQNPDNKHPIDCLSEWDMGCLFWIQTLIHILPQSFGVGGAARFLVVGTIG